MRKSFRYYNLLCKTTLRYVLKGKGHINNVNMLLVICLGLSFMKWWVRELRTSVEWIFIWWKTSPFINKTKHSTKKGTEKYKMKGPKSWQTKNPMKRGWTTRGTWTNQVPKQRILQREWIATRGTWTNQVTQTKNPTKGSGNIKGTGIKSSTQAFPKSWEAYKEREREHFNFILLWLDANEESEW
jgi:hypothetical protein